MPGVIVGLMIGLMGFAWWMQRPKNEPAEYLWHKPATVTTLSSNPVLFSNDTVKSEAVVVDTVNVSHLVCKPVETDENKPLIRNLTRPFEQRAYILQPGEKCTPE